MNTEGVKALNRLCTEHEIAIDVQRDLFTQVEYLEVLKTDILTALPTTTKRAKAFHRIEFLATTLATEIKALSFMDRMNLDNEYFFEDSLAGDANVFTLISDGAEHLDLGESTIPGIVAASRRVRERLDAVGKPGAKQTKDIHADFIRCIAQVMMKADVKPSATGLFFEFCAAIYLAAGLTLPERAMKHFLGTIRPKLRQDGRCL